MVFLIIDIVSFILFTFIRKEPSISSIKEETLSCSIANNDYLITIGNDSYFNCSNCDKNMQVYLRDITDWNHLEHSIENIEKYFKDNGGSCEKINE